MKKYQDIATLILRLAIAAGFFSAVASRLNLWGSRSYGWNNFLAYTSEVNSFASPRMVPFLAIASTTFEITLALLLLIGYKTRWAATGSSILSLLFALAMAYSFGVKEPLDYSVFVVTTAAFLLACMPRYRWSIDEILIQNKRK